jgi:hypothetical protein
MITLERVRYGLFALACAVYGGIGLLHFVWVAHDPKSPDQTHPFQLLFDPAAYVTQTQAIVGYGLFVAAGVIPIPLLVLTRATLRRKNLAG